MVPYRDVGLAAIGQSETLGGCVGGHSVVERLHRGVVQSLLHVGGLGLEGDVGADEDSLGQIEGGAKRERGREGDVVAYLVLLSTAQ